MSQEVNPGLGSPRDSPAASMQQGQGSRSTTTARGAGARRLVRSRAHVQPAGRAPPPDSGGDDRQRTPSPEKPVLFAYQEEAPAPASGAQNRGGGGGGGGGGTTKTNTTPSGVSPKDAAAAAKMLANPELQRRMMATGTSNPLHVWGQETSFLKSYFLGSQRRRADGKGGDGDPDGTAEMRDHMPLAGDDLWSPQTVEERETRPLPVAQEAAQNTRSNEASLRIFASGHPSSSSRAPHHSNGESGSSDSSDRADRRQGSGNRSRGADGGKGHRDGDEGERLLPDSDSPNSGTPPKAAMPSAWVSLTNARMRNMNALRAYSWDQRVFLPGGDGFIGTVFELLASPRVWEKVDWSIRGSCVAILPTLIVCLEPVTSNIFPLPTLVVFLAYWTTQPTLGAGLRETFTVVKAFIISLAFLCIVVAIQPGPKWLTILILFFSLAVAAFAAQQLRVMIAYCFASLMMQYVAAPEATTYTYIGNFYVSLFIGQGFAVGALVFPYIRWSSENARRYLIVMGDSVSLSVHGACCSFWVDGSLLERQLHVARLRQLRHTIEACIAKADKGLSEMGYEPHSGVYTTRLKTRMTFLKNVYNIVQSMTLVIEQIEANPTLIETPMCRAFGERVRGELGVAAAAMDAMLLRIVDLDNLVCAADKEAFRAAKARYEDAVSTVRDEVILSNESYHTDNSDILLGFFLFSVEELMEFISGFEDVAHCPSNLWYFLTFPMRDLQSFYMAFVDLYNAITLRHSITRRLKEGIKLSLTIALAAFFQTYALNDSEKNPIVGVDTIAFLYRSTGGDSFQYGQGRLLGTVLGCLTGLIGVQLADGRRPVLYVCTLVLTFVGSYIQASPDYGAIGNGMSNGVISVVLQYTNQDGAIVRIQQNCFAVIIYFIVNSLVWPVRCQTKVKTGFDGTMRMAREVTDRLLRNLDLPHSARAVSTDVLALLGEMQKKVGQQLQHVTGAKLEPTMDSAEFPEMAWRMLLAAERKLLVTLLMMRHAYSTFMTSTIGEATEPSNSGDGNGGGGGAVAAATSISVHWVVLHRISPYTRQLSQLFYEAMEVYLLLMSKVTFVPTSELTRLRLGMMQCYDRIVAVYIETLQHELRDDDDDDRGDLGDDSDTGDPAGATARPTAPVGSYIPVFTPSGLVVDAGTLEGHAASPKVPESATRRSGSRLSRSASSQHKKPGNAGGRISYKLTAEERQRLRNFVLGQHSIAGAGGNTGASTAAVVVPDVAGAVAAALANMGGNGSFTNNSMFNLNNTFFNRNASMFDPALLRNAGIVVQEPVHEETVESRRGGGGGTASACESTHHSTLRSSHRPGFRHLRSSHDEGGAVIDDASTTERAAASLPILPLGMDRSLWSEGPLGGSAVSAPPSLGHSRTSAASPDRDDPESVRGRPRLLSRMSGSQSLPSISPSPPVLSPSPPPSPPRPPLAPAKKIAPPASVLQNYAVLPTSVDLSTASPSAVRALSTAAQHSIASGPRPHGSHPTDAATANHTMLLSNTSMFMPSTTSGARVAGGDIFALGRASRALLRPPLDAAGGAHRADANTGDGGSTRRGEAATTTASERSAAQTAAPACESERSRSLSGAPLGALEMRMSPTSATATTAPHDDAAAAARAILAESCATVAHERNHGQSDGSNGGHDTRRRATLESSQEFTYSGTLGNTAVLRHSRETGGRTPAAQRRGTLHSGGTDDSEAGWEGAREAQGTALSDHSNQLDNTTSTLVHFPRTGQLPATLPIPAAATTASAKKRRGRGRGRRGSESSASSSDEDGEAGASGSGTAPFANTGALDTNTSFTATGPVIPPALRAYVEGLAAHQQQQTPPPPAMLGNMSFINMSSNLPAMTRTLPNGTADSAAIVEESARSGATLAPLPTAAHLSTTGGGVAHAGSSSVFSGSGPLPGAGGTSRLDDTGPRSFGVTNNSSNNNANTNTGTLVDLLRSFRGTQSFNPALLRLLQPPEGGGPDGGDGGNGEGDDGGDEYVLTNSDIHSLEAFLFGLRALITQVEEVERYLLEVVHGMEMAKKL